MTPSRRDRAILCEDGTRLLIESGELYQGGQRQKPQDHGGESVVTAEREKFRRYVTELDSIRVE
jgi:hypothetical protein